MAKTTAVTEAAEVAEASSEKDAGSGSASTGVRPKSRSSKNDEQCNQFKQTKKKSIRI